MNHPHNLSKKNLVWLSFSFHNLKSETYIFLSLLTGISFCQEEDCRLLMLCGLHLKKQKIRFKMCNFQICIINHFLEECFIKCILKRLLVLLIITFLRTWKLKILNSLHSQPTWSPWLIQPTGLSEREHPCITLWILICMLTITGFQGLQLLFWNTAVTGGTEFNVSKGNSLICFSAIRNVKICQISILQSLLSTPTKTWWTTEYTYW